MSSPTPLRRELLASLGVLFGGVTLILGIAISLVLPFLRSTGEATVFILVIVAVDLVIVLTFGGWALKKNLLEPVDELVSGVKKIADGDYRHRLEIPKGLELRSIAESVNAMADRLIAGQEVLAENVRSLDDTNLKLVEARNEVIQAVGVARCKEYCDDRPGSARSWHQNRPEVRWCEGNGSNKEIGTEACEYRAAETDDD